MAISDIESEIPLLEDTVVGVVDYRGFTAKRSSSGGWRSASFIIGVELAERIAYYGIGSNLISYLTGPLRQPLAVAAQNVNTFNGTGYVLPLLGAFVADSILGRYRTVVIASLLYILGLGLLTLSAMLPSLSSSYYYQNNTESSPPYEFQKVLFFFSLYLVAVAQSGHKPCTQAFGADQFDGQHPEECKAKSSFFNWWFFGLCIGVSVAFLVLSYIQDNLNWGLGFGIPCIIMVAALLLFLLGTKTYRYAINTNAESPFVRIGKVFVEASRNWRTAGPPLKAAEEPVGGTLPNHHGSHQFEFLSKALLTLDGSKEHGRACSFSDVEEAKAVLRLLPIWITSLLFSILPAQLSTFFTKQGISMDRSTGLGFDIPAASLQSLDTITIVIFIPIYDRMIVPIARQLTGKPSGISMLQRIGTGMFLYVISMVVAAIVEVKRLKEAEEHGLVDTPNVTIPMRVWWLAPQYVLCGVGDALAMVGFQEFFYDQVPNELRSVGIALYLSIFGLGSFLSSFLISAIEKVTSRDGQDGWFTDNLNKAHLDYFYWLLAGLGLLGLAGYMYFAKTYVYNKKVMV